MVYYKLDILIYNSIESKVYFSSIWVRRNFQCVFKLTKKYSDHKFLIFQIKCLNFKQCNVMKKQQSIKHIHCQLPN